MRRIEGRNGLSQWRVAMEEFATGNIISTCIVCPFEKSFSMVTNARHEHNELLNRNKVHIYSTTKVVRNLISANKLLLAIAQDRLTLQER